MRRIYPSRPIVAVGGVIYADSKILLSKRRDSPDKFMWSIPGGAVEKGETLLAALKREIREECGVSVEKAEPFLIFDKIYKDIDMVVYHYVIIDFFIDDFSGKLEPGSDSLALEFFDIDSLKGPGIPKNIFHMKKYVRQFLQNGRSIYLSFEEQLVKK